MTLAARLTAQLLAGEPARDPVAVTERLLAVQGQDPRGFRLAIRARTTGLTAADVDRALTEDRSLSSRGSTAARCTSCAARTTPGCTLSRRRRSAPASARGSASWGVERGGRRRAACADREVARRRRTAHVGRSCASGSKAGGVPAQGQAFGHILFLASQRGLIVRGPMAGREHLYALVQDWLGPQPQVDRDAALAELARRYLAGHGPADDRDLARWSGLPLRDTRAGLHAIASQLHHRDDGLVELAGGPPAADIPPPRLLGAFDPVLLGWVSREQLLDVDRNLVTIGGMFYPFALVRGRAAALWTLRDGKVGIEPFDRITKKDTAALEADAAEVLRFLEPG